MRLRNLLTEAANILVHGVNPDACEAFLRKYPKIRQTITAIARKNKDLMKGYKAFLRFKDGNEQYFGGRAEVTKSDTFGEKTFWKYDWMGVTGWAEVYQYLDGVKESVNEAVTMKDYDEHVNPFKLTIHLSNGKSIDIKPKSNYREKAYQLWLKLLNDYDHDSRAKQAVDTAINKMGVNLQK
jgi:hypothetical protein